jgi:xanthine phosphoribosyltransferase
VPAALVARELDIRLVDTICVTSYDSGAGERAQVQGSVRVLKGVTGDGEGYLLIDDLVDTGAPRRPCASSCRRPTSPRSTPSPRAADRRHVREGVQADEVDPLPWDIEYSFATPIKDGGRAIAGP